MPLTAAEDATQASHLVAARRDALVAAAKTNLTQRELQVLIGMSRGMSNRAIATELYLVEDTIKTHVRRLLRKLGARNRAHAVNRGWELGIFGAGGVL